MPEWLASDDYMSVGIVIAALVLIILKVLPRFLAGVPFVAPQDVHDQISANPDAVVLDVREPAEFTDELGHIKGAVNLPLNDVPKTLAENNDALKQFADTPLFVVCRTSKRAAMAARVLRKAGLTKVSVMSGGMIRWKRTRLPVER